MYHWSCKASREGEQTPLAVRAIDSLCIMLWNFRKDFTSNYPNIASHYTWI
jgi:hypothetical protein